ncbi:MAG: hypothetical protein EBT12_06350 [Marivivens sp.]|nr:hypothetical protein [Marivivens sp.]
MSGSGTDSFVFKYIVGPSDATDGDLAVRGFVRNDATFSALDASGDVAGEVDLRVRVGTSNDGASSDIVYRGTSSSAADDDSTVEVVTQSLSTGADLIAPRLLSLSASSGTYSPGDDLEIRATFSEAVVVNADGGVPTLQLTANGEALTVFALR